MSDDITFTDGMICKSPSAQAPDFVKVSVSFKVEEMIETLQRLSKEGWVNAVVKESKAGKWYAQQDTWEPTKQEEYATGAKQAREAMASTPPPSDNFQDTDIPF
jgi:single-stranded DNA-binding protein